MDKKRENGSETELTNAQGEVLCLSVGRERNVQKGERAFQHQDGQWCDRHSTRVYRQGGDAGAQAQARPLNGTLPEWL